MTGSDEIALVTDSASHARPSTRKPTPIPVSKRTRNLIILVIVALLALILWTVPVVLVVTLGGFAIALVLSFPVSLLSRYMPRSLAILLSFLILLAMLLLASYVLLPMIVKQMAALIAALPDLTRNLEQIVLGALVIWKGRQAHITNTHVITGAFICAATALLIARGRALMQARA